MSDSQLPYSAARAEDKFYQMRRKGAMQGWWARIFGKDNDLMPFHEVLKLVRNRRISKVERQAVPLDKIIGSEGRYQDFTRAFFPKEGANKERWKRLDQALNKLETLPPVELYKIGDAYFVRDGHHRVSVARANGLKEIDAYVYEVETDIPVTTDTDLQTLALEAGKKRFLEKSGIEQIRPEANIVLTAPGRYYRLLEHIDVHRYYMGLEQKREIPYEEAVASWYDNVYMPFVKAVRDSGVLERFPGRTESDLYVWVIENRDKLQQIAGRPLSSEETVKTFAEAHKEKPVQTMVRLLKRAVGRMR